MSRTYRYKGFSLEVTIESNFSWPDKTAQARAPAYVTIVTIARTGTSVAIFSPLRLGLDDGKHFPSEADALMTGYSAARRLVDDLLAVEAYLRQNLNSR